MRILRALVQGSKAHCGKCKLGALCASRDVEGNTRHQREIQLSYRIRILRDGKYSATQYRISPHPAYSMKRQQVDWKSASG